MKHGLIGAAMAAMMLWMLHEPIMSGGVSFSLGALAFVMAHVVVLAAGSALALLVPKIRLRLHRHRPNLQHMAAMLGGAIVLSGSVHVVLHGGI